MKVLVLSHLYPNHCQPHFGVFIQREVKALSRLCSIRVIAPVPLNFFKKMTPEEIKVSDTLIVYYKKYLPLPGISFLPFKGRWFYIFLKKLVLKIKESFNFDIIHAHMVYPTGFCAVLLGKMLQKPVVISIRGADINKLSKHKIIRKMIIYTLQKACTIIVVSESLRQRVLALGIDKEKVKLMAKGVDLEKFKPLDRRATRKKLKLPFDKTVVLSIGHLIPRKNPLGVIDSFLCIPEAERKNYLFIWIGEGPLEKQVRQRIKEKGLESNFKLAGRISPDDIPFWINAADMFILASLSEGMPNVLYEAFACQIPVIATAVDGAREIIKNNENGVLIKPSNPKELVNAIMRLGRDGVLRDKIAKAGRAFIEKNNLTWAQNALWLKDIYEDVIIKGEA